jgi:hypothetical protein
MVNQCKVPSNVRKCRSRRSDWVLRFVNNRVTILSLSLFLLPLPSLSLSFGPEDQSEFEVKKLEAIKRARAGKE